MKKQKSAQLNSKNKLLFRKWSRKNYAVFNSLHKVIKICTLIAAYNLVSKPITAQVEKDTIFINKSISLEETVVESNRIPLLYSEVARIVNIISAKEIEHSPVKGISDLLNYAINVDTRQRGINDVQSDISIRGGSFEQTLILLNGVIINDPQTGHHNLDIPISINDIEKIEILEGPASRIFGPNAFSGAINIITKHPNTNSINFSTNAGSNSSYLSNIAGSFKIGKIQNYISASNSSSKGYTNNTDYKINTIYYNSNISFKTSRINIQAGLNNKQFGANSFYTAAFPEQYEKTGTTFASAKYEIGKSVKYAQYLYYRKHKDWFQLKRYEPEFYTNNHLTNIYGINGNLIFNSSFGRTSTGWELKSENILSNSLGENLIDSIEVPNEPGYYFYRSGHRSYFNYFVEQYFKIGNFTFSGGLLANFNNKYGFYITPGVDLSFRLNPELKIFMTSNKSIRLPSYTELYYHDMQKQGNVNLNPEKSFTNEIGLKYTTSFINTHLSVYRRNGTDIIDWVRFSETDKWETKNLTTIISNGFEISASVKPQIIYGKSFFLNNVSINYSYILQQKLSNTYYSLYVMDYLKNKLFIGITHSIIKNIEASWKIIVKDRAGTYTDFESGNETSYNPFVTFDGKISFNYNKLNIYTEVMNILNTTYFDYGNLEMPGRYLWLGLKYSIIKK
ncbi:MAG: TonB-dependent receptor [Chlorobi bacterium]|nr:TonB-dependent receptor [Chlorobiota bacterium]